VRTLREAWKVVMLVVLGWWRLLFGGREHRDAPSRDNQEVAIDTLECRRAVHEAGHAVAAWCCTAASDVHITIEAKDGGKVTWMMHGDSIDVLWHRLVIALAGAAAEAMVYKRSRPEASSASDFQAAREYAELIGRAPAPWGDPGGPTIAFDKIYRASPISTPARANLEAAYRMARRVIRAHGRDYYRIVSLLLTRRTVREHDVVHILGHRGPMRLLAPFGPRFVLPRRTKKAA
jgi:hypothetical protein